MAKRKGITCCDSTDHGGLVLEGYATMAHNGHQVAGLNHQVYCPQCKGIFPIVESLASCMGYAPALEGMRTACGARLIATHDDLWFDDDTATAKDLPPVAPAHGMQGMPAASTPVAQEERVTHAAAAAATARAPSGTQAPSDTRGANTSGAAVTGTPDTSTAPATADTPQAVHVVLRIGVFHDGTGNNYTNSREALELCSPEALKLKPALHPDIVEQMQASCRLQHGMDGASYDGGETNVHRLFDLYRSTDTMAETNVARDGRRYVYRHVYVQGIGTLAEHPDSVWSSATGYGPTGVIDRALQAVHKVVSEIVDFVRKSPSALITIDAVEFDLFGFSRGAAAARHLAWLIRHGGDSSVMARALRGDSRDGTDPAHGQGGLPLKPGWNKQDLRIRFIGLFDTVAAVGLPGHAYHEPVHLYLSKDCADTVVHLAARDECRLNFASNTVKPHPTILLPGVHSDVGGGYPMEGWEHLILGQPETSEWGIDDPRHPPAPTTSTAWKRAYRQLREYGWSDDTLLDIQSPADEKLFKLYIGTWTRLVQLTYAMREMRKQWARSPQLWQEVVAAVELQRKVRGDYQFIPLRLMHTLATEAGVPFGKSPDDVPDLALPTELLPIHDKLLAYARAAGRGKVPLSADEERLLRRRYVHQSANWDPLGWVPHGPGQPDPLPVGLPSVAYTNRPAPHRQRRKFDPRPGE